VRTGGEVLVATRNNADRPPAEVADSGVRTLRCTAEWDRIHLQEGTPARTAGLMAGIVALSQDLFRRVEAAGFAGDVVHNHSFATVPLACEISERHHLPLISTVHVLDDMLDEAQGASRPRTTDRHVNRALEAEGLRHSHAIVTPSETVRRALVQGYPDLADRVRVLPHPSTGEVTRKRDYEPHDPFRLLYVGRMISYKGVRELLTAAAKLSGIELWMVGDGPARTELAEQASRDGVPVRWLGQRPRSEVLRLYAQVDAVAVLSLVETYCLALQEAQRAGVPIICTNIAAFDERVRDGRDCLAVPVHLDDEAGRVDVDALTEAIETLGRNTALRRQLGRNAIRSAANQQTLAEHAAMLHKIAAAL
jgi:glycosyltransferase involved in cell wall biosynthesis